MAMNGLRKLAHVLETGTNEIRIDADVLRRASVSIKRMLDFAAGIRGSSGN